MSLQIEDVKSVEKDGKVHTTTLLRRSKTDQESTGRCLHLSESAQAALTQWLEIINEDKDALFRGITNNQRITGHLGAGQVNRIYKNAARNAQLDENLIERISGHSCRVGAAQNLVSSGASLCPSL